MDVAHRYRGKQLSHEDVGFIRELIASHPKQSRRALSSLLCLAWRWTQKNGAACDMVARGLMLDLERKGAITLPPKRNSPRNPLASRKAPTPIEVDTTPVEGALADFRPLEIRLVRRTKNEPLFNSLIEKHHYLGYTQPVGAHLKYLVLSKDRPIACLSFSSAPRHLGPRDRFIGWSKEARKQNIRFVAYNPRYLILPWVNVKHLASHVLGRILRRLSSDFDLAYGHPLYFLETFVDPALYRGTCYLASNWIVLGRTTGRGKDSTSKKPNRSLKDVLGYPLVPDFRERLACLP